jgi:hypothetical protein
VAAVEHGDEVAALRGTEKPLPNTHSAIQPCPAPGGLHVVDPSSHTSPPHERSKLEARWSFVND